MVEHLTGVDPAAIATAAKRGVVPVSTVDAYDKVSAAIPLDPTGTMAFVSIGRNVSGRPQETRGRIYAVNLKGQSSDLVWDRPAAVKVLGHDAELEIRGGGAVLWKRSTTNPIPTILRLQEGETVQDAVKRYENPTQTSSRCCTCPQESRSRKSANGSAAVN